MTLSGVVVRTPDGKPLFDNLNLSFGREHAAVVGRNGVGKTTLFRLIAGDFPPHAGSIYREGRLAVVQQVYLPAEGETVGQTLGLGEQLAVLERVLAGKGSNDDLADADWTLESRMEQALAEVGLAGLSPNLPTAVLSGGEQTRLRLAAAALAAPDLLLLDEPTNHLDEAGRQLLLDWMTRWQGGLVIISHDRALLRAMNRIIELSNRGARAYGGNWDYYFETRRAEQAALAHQHDQARRDVARARNEAQEALERQARRDRAGRRSRAGSSDPKILLDARTQRAEETGARLSRLATRRQALVDQRLTEIAAQVERKDVVPMILPDPGLVAGRVVLEMTDVEWGPSEERRVVEPLDLRMVGPERVALTGANGSGKSTLLKLIDGTLEPTGGRIQRMVPVARLDQGLSGLDEKEDLVEAWLRCHPQGILHDAQESLARFGFRNLAARRRFGELSGGERLRAALACVMGGPLPVSLLLLDEPTNHLDLAAVEALEEVLRAYRGALIVASHDREFLDNIGVDREIRL